MHTVAEHVYHTKTVLRYFKSHQSKASSSSSSSANDGLLASCTLSKAVAIHFLRDALTAKQLRVEIWAQSTKSSSKGSWEIERAASPGNLEGVEDLLFANTDILETPTCMAILFKIKDGIKTVGLAYADSVERKIGISEFVETDIFSNTEVGPQSGREACALYS